MESCGFGLCVVDGGECRGQLLRGCGVEVRDVPGSVECGEELIQDFRPLVVFVLAREKFLSSVGVSRFMRAPFECSVWLEDGCHAAKAAFVMDECPFLPGVSEGVAWSQIGACMAKDRGVIPS